MSLIWQWFAIYMRGFAMGVVELIPGISGGTIALIVGIYSRLLTAIGRFNWAWLKLIAGWGQGQHGIKQVIQHIDGSFLLLLVLGMGTAIFSLAGLMHYLLQEYDLLLGAFFFGLILGVSYALAKQAGTPRKSDISVILAGVVVGFSLSQLSFSGLEPEPWVLVIAGGVASCAWILPGISGSFLLLATGLYGHFIAALATRDWAFMAFAGLGMVLGLPVFSRMLSRVLQLHKHSTLYFLLAFMVSSLYQLWPWQQSQSYYYAADGSAIPLATKPMLPSAWQQLTGEDPMVAMTLGLMLIALVLVMLTERKWKDTF